MKRQILSVIINLGLLFVGIIMTFSGLLIQFNYHMGNHGDIDTNNLTFGIDYSGWSNIHTISSIIVLVFMIFHTFLHWKWYKTVVKRKLFFKNRQVIILSLVFIVAALIGYLSWSIKLTGGDEVLRRTFIEIHDKLALILFVYLILHVTKRLKWYTVFFKK